MEYRQRINPKTRDLVSQRAEPYRGHGRRSDSVTRSDPEDVSHGDYSGYSTDFQETISTKTDASISTYESSQRVPRKDFFDPIMQNRSDEDSEQDDQDEQELNDPEDSQSREPPTADRKEAADDNSLRTEKSGLDEKLLYDRIRRILERNGQQAPEHCHGHADQTREKNPNVVVKSAQRDASIMGDFSSPEDLRSPLENLPSMATTQRKAAVDVLQEVQVPNRGDKDKAPVGSPAKPLKRNDSISRDSPHKTVKERIRAIDGTQGKKEDSLSRLMQPTCSSAGKTKDKSKSLAEIAPSAQRKQHTRWPTSSRSTAPQEDKKKQEKTENKKVAGRSSTGQIAETNRTSTGLSKIVRDSRMKAPTRFSSGQLGQIVRPAAHVKSAMVSKTAATRAPSLERQRITRKDSENEIGDLKKEIRGQPLSDASSRNSTGSGIVKPLQTQKNVPPFATQSQNLRKSKDSHLQRPTTRKRESSVDSISRTISSVSSEGMGQRRRAPSVDSKASTSGIVPRTQTLRKQGETARPPKRANSLESKPRVQGRNTNALEPAKGSIQTASLLSKNLKHGITLVSTNVAGSRESPRTRDDKNAPAAAKSQKRDLDVQNKGDKLATTLNIRDRVSELLETAAPKSSKMVPAPTDLNLPSSPILTPTKLPIALTSSLRKIVKTCDESLPKTPANGDIKQLPNSCLKTPDITSPLTAKDEDVLEEGIRVAIRMRPLNDHEGHHKRVWEVFPRYSSVTQTTTEGQPLNKKVIGRNFFTFDKTFGETTATSEVYDSMAKGIVNTVMKGMNGTIFAYGQTSSGKTYTMQGSKGGLLQMAAQDIFDHVEQVKDRLFLVRVSFLEIYNEDIRDLLANDGPDKLAVREGQKRGIFVPSHEEIVSDKNALIDVLDKGNKKRSIAATAMNERSSRSHTIFRITIESKKKDCETPASPNKRDDAVLVSTLNMVDLAGSESVRHTGASGNRLKEGGMINQSLLTLSRVIVALGSSSQSHINFRDSKLTRILQPSLSGNARLAVICCATPSELYLEETRSTLAFAARAKLVMTNPIVNEVLDDRSLIRRLQKELVEARKKAGHRDALERQAAWADSLARAAEGKLQKLHRVHSHLLKDGMLSFHNEGTAKRSKRRHSDSDTLCVLDNTDNSNEKEARSMTPKPKKSKLGVASIFVDETPMLRMALNSKVQSLNSTEKQLEDVCKQLLDREKEIETLRLQVGTLHALTDSQASTIQQRDEELDSLKMRLQDREGRDETDLQNQCEQVQLEKEEALAACDGVNTLMQDMIVSLEKAEASNEDLQKELTQAQEHAASIENELADIKRERETMAQSVRGLIQDLRGTGDPVTRHAIAAVESEKRHFEACLEEETMRLRAVELEYKEADDERFVLRSNGIAMEGELNILRDELRSLRRQQSTTADVEELQALTISMCAGFSDSESHCSALMKVLGDCSGEAKHDTLNSCEKRDELLLCTTTSALEGTLSLQVGEVFKAQMVGQIAALIQTLYHRMDKATVLGQSDRVMKFLLQALSINNAEEELFMAIGSVIYSLEEQFATYLDNFVPMLLEGFKSAKAESLQSIYIGVVVDLCNSVGGRIQPFSDGIMEALFMIAHNRSSKNIKPAVISCFGDMALSIGTAFQPYIKPAMMIILQASRQPAPLDNEDMMSFTNQLKGSVFAFSNRLHCSVLEAYSGLIVGLADGTVQSEFTPYLPSVLMFLSSLASDDTKDDRVLQKAVGVLGDVAQQMGHQAGVKQHFSEGFVETLLQDAIKSTNETTKQKAVWADEVIQNVCTLKE